MLTSCVAKPIMATNSTIRKDVKTDNVMLTCDVKYAYPTANITWNITTESSGVYHMVKENSNNGNYVLLSNGSLEIYHRYVYEENHVTAVCSAANKYGSAQTVFSVWDPDYFSQG